MVRQRQMTWLTTFVSNAYLLAGPPCQSAWDIFLNDGAQLAGTPGYTIHGSYYLQFETDGSMLGVYNANTGARAFWF